MNAIKTECKKNFNFFLKTFSDQMFSGRVMYDQPVEDRHRTDLLQG